jgi:hypothetical protein
VSCRRSIIPLARLALVPTVCIVMLASSAPASAQPADAQLVSITSSRDPAPVIVVQTSDLVPYTVIQPDDRTLLVDLARTTAAPDVPIEIASVRTRVARLTTQEVRTAAGPVLRVRVRFRRPTRPVTRSERASIRVFLEPAVDAATPAIAVRQPGAVEAMDALKTVQFLPASRLAVVMSSLASAPLSAPPDLSDLGGVDLLSSLAPRTLELQPASASRPGARDPVPPEEESPPQRRSLRGVPWPRPDPGHLRYLKVLMTSAPPVIDGRLDEGVWTEAEVGSNFWISEVQRHPREQTEVRVAADSRSLYVAFTCWDSQPAGIRAAEMRRDGNVSLDDHVIVELDPYHNHRLVSRFLVSARGTQADAPAGGRARKIEWKGDWRAAARRTPDGWTAEMAIPFDVLTFEAGLRTIGINFVRYHARTQEWSRWADITPQGLSEEAGHLTALTLPQVPHTSRLLAMQYATASASAGGGSGTDVASTTGVDARYDIRNNLSNVFTVNPDFSQIDEDVLGLAFSYNEKVAADRRPFFQEGAAFFGTTAHFHSARIPDFDVGLKSFGRLGVFQGGVLAVAGADGRRDYVARLLREFGPAINLSATYVGTDRADVDNRLLAVHAGGRLGRRLSFAANAASTATAGGPGDGNRVSVALGYHSSFWHTGVSADRTDGGFFPANGVIAGDLLGTEGLNAYVSYGREYPEGRLRRLDGSASFTARETATDLVQRRDLSLYVSGETRANILFSLGTSQGRYRPRSDARAGWAVSLFRDTVSTAGLYFNTRSDRYGYGLTYSWGVVGGSGYGYLAPSAWIQLVRGLHTAFSYERADYDSTTHQSVVSVSWQITPEQSVMARWLQFGESFYRLVYRRAVRRGIDVYAIYHRDPLNPDRLVLKAVWTLAPLPRF